MKFAFIHAEKAGFSVAALCRTLGVTRQGYYASLKRTPSQRLARDAELQRQVRATFLESGKRYGSPRVHQQLRREGWQGQQTRGGASDALPGAERS